MTGGRMKGDAITILQSGAVPISPGGRLVRQILARDVAQSLEHPAVGLRVQGWVIRVIQQLWNCGAALLLTEHAGLCEVTSGAFTDKSRRVIMKSLQQRSDGLVSAHEPQALDRPVARRLIGVLEVSDQDFSHPLKINPAISQEPERPKRPVPLGLNFRFGLVYEKLNVG